MFPVHDPGDEETDAELVAAVRAARPGAFERLVARYQGLVWHVVRRLVPEREDARDLGQETFLRVHQRLEQWRGDSALRAWIGQVAYSIALRHLERRRTRREHEREPDEHAPEPADPLDLEDAYARHDDARRLDAAIARLPELPRTILLLYHVDELGIPEISAITGVPEGTIKSHLYRTRARLAAMLEEVEA